MTKQEHVPTKYVIFQATDSVSVKDYWVRLLARVIKIEVGNYLHLDYLVKTKPKHRTMEFIN